MISYSKLLSNKKLLVLVTISILLIIVVGVFLFSIKKNNAPVLKPITLEYWGINESEADMLVLINEYKKIHPNVTINYSNKQLDDDLVRYRKTLLTRLKESTGPSIFRIHSTWVGEYLNELTVATGELSDGTSYKNRFYGIAIDQCTSTSGQVYCVPLKYDGLLLLYNKNMFDKAGFQKPVTWEDIRSLAIRLTERNGDTITRSGLALGTALNVTNSTDVFGLMLAQSGVSIPDGLDTDSATAALTFYRAFSKKDKVWNSSMQNSILAFATEKTAMVFAKREDIEKILSINPTLKFVVTDVPQLPDLNGKIKQKSWASLWVEAVSADLDEDQKKSAWEFLNWLSKPTQQKALFSEVKKTSKVGYVYSDKSLKVELKEMPYLSVAAEGAPYAITSFITDNTGNDNYVQALKAAIDSGGDEKTDLKVVKAVLSK